MNLCVIMADILVIIRIRERYYYDLLNPLLNMIRPFISEEEHIQEKAKYDAKYREYNKETETQL